MTDKNWVNNPTKKQLWLVVGLFAVAFILVSAAGTDLYSHAFDFDQFFVLGMMMMLNFVLVVRVVVNYLKNRDAAR